MYLITEWAQRITGRRERAIPQNLYWTLLRAKYLGFSEEPVQPTDQCVPSSAHLRHYEAEQPSTFSRWLKKASLTVLNSAGPHKFSPLGRQLSCLVYTKRLLTLSIRQKSNLFIGNGWNSIVCRICHVPGRWKGWQLGTWTQPATWSSPSKGGWWDSKGGITGCSNVPFFCNWWTRQHTPWKAQRIYS